ncbi:hypothetical protein DFH07DRAFT_783930 [Mycena maculata]|uniref:Uncharacterized protein n=1 Tax=Mycena maculata TaxID=230809 RepID=A0AAD7HJQ7_9AGAR|nr:hypothetical protein DFH07DRAFT_783930 [Mycena maculata]
MGGSRRNQQKKNQNKNRSCSTQAQSSTVIDSVNRQNRCSQNNTAAGEPPPEAVAGTSRPTSGMPAPQGSDILYSNSTLSGTPSGMSLLVNMVPSNEDRYSIPQRRPASSSGHCQGSASISADNSTPIISNGHQVTIEEVIEEENVRSSPPRRRASSLPAIPESTDSSCGNKKTRRSQGSLEPTENNIHQSNNPSAAWNTPQVIGNGPREAKEDGEGQAPRTEASAQSLATLERLSAPASSPTSSNHPNIWDDDMRRAVNDAVQRERTITEDTEQYQSRVDTLCRLQR